MCVTPGSLCARSSSTPSNAPRPSRAACGLQTSVQPGAAVAGGGTALLVPAPAPTCGDDETAVLGPALPEPGAPVPASGGSGRAAAARTRPGVAAAVPVVTRYSWKAPNEATTTTATVSDTRTRRERSRGAAFM